jgi:hypothetical protein
MEVNFTPATEKKLRDFSAQSGRRTDEVVEDAVAGYFDEVLQVSQMLDGRYDDLASGRVKPIDGEEFFEELRLREDELLKRRSSQ